MLGVSLASTAITRAYPPASMPRAVVHAVLVHVPTRAAATTTAAGRVADPRRYRRASTVLGGYLESLAPRADAAPSADLLDTNIRSAATRLQVQKASSQISKRWHIVTAIQPTDFVAALEAARDA